MAWEAAAAAQPDRRSLAAMVLTHRVLPHDPLAAAADEVPDSLLPDPGEPIPAR